MARWSKTIDIKQYLDPDRPAADVAKDIGAALGRSIAFRESGLMDALEALPKDATADELDELLVKVYDLADERRIWLGVRK